MNLREPDNDLENTDILDKLWSDKNEVAKFEKLFEKTKEADLSKPENTLPFVHSFLSSISEQLAQASSIAVSMYRLLHCNRKMLEKNSIKDAYPSEIKEQVERMFKTISDLTNVVDRDGIQQYIEAERNVTHEESKFEE